MKSRIIAVYLFICLLSVFNLHIGNICAAEEAVEFEEFTGPLINYPRFSPDGNKIIFASDISNQGRPLWLINPDGSGMEKIEITPFGGGIIGLDGSDIEIEPGPIIIGPSLEEDAVLWYPAWLPDGSKIAFIYNWDIWTINRDGTNLTQLTSDGSADARKDFISFSPDGTKIAFCDGDGDISIMNLDGTMREKLVSGNCPAWSPDGSQIVYTRQFNSAGKIFFNIWKINLDGTQEEQLTSGDYNDVEPSWSPDGSSIAFSSDRSGEGQEIWTISSGGAGLFQVTHNADGWSPSWSPDGNKIIFGADNIAEVDIGSGEEHQITHFQACRLPFKQFFLKHWQIHWNREETHFTISGKLTLPDNYNRSDLKKKAEINIGINKKDDDLLIQKASVDFQEHGPVWFYRGAQNTQPDTDGLIIDRMLIFWQPEDKNNSKKKCIVNDSWFFIKGRLNVAESEKENLLSQAKLTINIPIQNITTAGALESSEEVSFKEQRNLWSYNAASHQRWQDWKDNWWEKVKEGKED